MTQVMIIALITNYATMFGVDPRLAVSVARVESNLDPAAISEDGHDQGLFQLRDSSYPGYSKKALRNVRLNIFLGVLHLKRVKESCIHRQNLDWLVCYNYGEENAKHVKHPSLFPYVRKVASDMRNNKLELAGQVGYNK